MLPKKALMDHVSRPLIALLVGTVAFFALWIFALKPTSSNNASPASGGSLQSAVTKAHQAVALSNAVSAAHGGNVGIASQPTPRPTSAPAKRVTGAAPHARAITTHTPPQPHVVTGRVPSTANRLDAVARALAGSKVLALLFYNPSAADDRAVRQELAAVPLHSGRVVELAVPINELSRYPVVTAQVPVDLSPTLVVIGRNRLATTIVGFADRFEISQRVTDALSAR
jgi:hypothetical protein